MGGTERTILHLPYFEALAETEESSAEWRTRSAGLLVLRLFDSWVSEGRSAVAADAWAPRAVREAISAIPPGSPVRALLLSVLDAIEASTGTDIAIVAPRLMAYARALQFDSEWKLAADVYRTVIAHAHPVQESDIAVAANLQLGLCLRMLAEWTGASAAYSTAGSLATVTGDMMSALRARIGEAKLAIDRGNLPQAELMLDQTIEEAGRRELNEVRAVALHDRATVAHQRRQYDLAIQLGYEALKWFRDPRSRDRVLGDVAGSFSEIGLRDAARDAYLILAGTAQEQYTRWQATINLMEIAALDGSEPVFEQYRRELVDAPLPAGLAVYYHLYVGRGYRTFRNVDAARAALDRSIQIASENHLNQPLIEAEQTLQEIRDGGVVIVAAIPEPSPAVVNVAGALKEMRAMAGASA